MKRINRIYLFNIIWPLVVGAIFYYLYEPNIIFVKAIDSFLKVNFHMVIPQNRIVAYFRNYGIDMLWGYSLMFILVLIVGNKIAELLICLGIAVTFSIMMEMLQIIASIPGTYDIIDILVEILSEVIAVCIVKHFGGIKYEEDY